LSGHVLSPAVCAGSEPTRLIWVNAVREITAGDGRGVVRASAAIAMIKAA
jgi:hypothetical protein